MVAIRAATLLPAAYVALTLLHAGAAHAQEVVHAACAPRSAPDAVERKVVHLNLRPAGEHVRLPLATAERNRLTLLLQFVYERFVAPESVTLQPLARDVIGAAHVDLIPMYSPDVEGMIVFRAHSDGRISDVRMLRASGASALDSAVLGALATSAEQDDLGMLGFDFAGDSTDHLPRSADLVLTFETKADSAGGTHPLAVIGIGRYAIRQAIAARGNTAPPYPRELRNAGRNGDVLVTFIVDTSGMAELDTFRVLESSDPAFTFAVRLHLPKMRYLPAEVAGCRMRQWIIQPFSFRVSGSMEFITRPPSDR